MGTELENRPWCTAHLESDGNWWVEALSDAVHWDREHPGLIDPRQLEYLWELLSPLRECGFQEELMERAFGKFRIGEELPQERVRLVAVDTPLARAEEPLFLLPYAHSDADGRCGEFIEHLRELRVKWLNLIFDFDQPLEPEDVELSLRDPGEGTEGVHAFENIAAILEYLPPEAELDRGDPEGLEKKSLTEGLLPDLEEDEISWEKELKEDIYRLEMSE